MSDSKPREYWIFKGESDLCSELVFNDDYTAEVKSTPDGFYDIVALADTVDGGIHVIERSYATKLEQEIAELKAELAKTKSATFEQVLLADDVMRAQLAAHKEALREAQDIIHSEFCSQNHHPQCTKFDAILGDKESP